MTKFIFVTGPGGSSLGKGLAAGLSGACSSAGLKVTLPKLDPYINVDREQCRRFSTVKCSSRRRRRDRSGSRAIRAVHSRRPFAGQQLDDRSELSLGNKQRTRVIIWVTIQVIPHITNEIKDAIRAVADGPDVVIVEVGGTVGDIESLPFLESIRQMGNEEGRGNALFIHLTLVPFIAASGELKSKPTQHSVKELREIGIQPDILLCRCDRPLPKDRRRDRDVLQRARKKKITADSKLLRGTVCLRAGPRRHERQEAELQAANAIAQMVRVARQSRSPSRRLARIVGQYANVTDSYKAERSARSRRRCQRVGVQIGIGPRSQDDANWEVSPDFTRYRPGGFGKRGIWACAARPTTRVANGALLGIWIGMQCAKWSSRERVWS